MAKLTRDTLTDLAARELVSYIRTERLRPGDALPAEGRLAERFGVSRPVIREALQVLRGRGLLDAQHHRTATVAGTTGTPLAGFVEHALLFAPRGPLRLLEFRRGVEVESARLAAVHAGCADLDGFRTTVRRMAASLRDLPAYIDADVELHDRIAAASHNPLIADFVASVRRATRETIELGLRSRMSEAELIRVQEAHERLVDALVARDPDAAGYAMAFQFDDALHAIRRSLDADGEAAEPHCTERTPDGAGSSTHGLP
ncbi:MAG: FadR/GntR family transcriptional regulator [Trueperaceae bacterium]